MTYRIRDWAKYFENNRTRELVHMAWVPIPNKHDGDGFTDIMSREHGMEIYGTWQVILQVASKCEPRGTLLRDGQKPYDPASLARRTHSRAEYFERAIPVLIEVGWLEVIPESTSTLQNLAPSCGNPAPSCAEVAPCRQEGKGTERNGMEGKEIPADAGAVPHDEFQKAWNGLGGPFAKISVWNIKRQMALRTRWADSFFRDNWRNGLEKLKASRFCRGENERGWRADLDFFLKPSSLPKIIEGKYDGGSNGTTAKNLNGRPSNGGYRSPEQAADWARLAARTVQVRADSEGPAADSKRLGPG